MIERTNAVTGQNKNTSTDQPPNTLANTPFVGSMDATTDASHLNGVRECKPESSVEHLGNIGDYQIVETLGRGGMGVVYLARHLHLNQLFAIKMLRNYEIDDSRSSDKFVREAQVVADLRHRGIVQVHHFAMHHGQPYLVMEYLPAGSLDKKLKSSLYTPRDAAVLASRLAEALQAAHDKNIIHRDLKPHNILLTEQGEPKITDFGLARRTDITLTREHSYLGTPPYMPPEQARGDIANVDERSDIYSLGAILYEMLTGRPPFRGSNDIETMRMVCDAEVVAVRTLQPRVPIELETICLHCLQKDPARRYSSASLLCRDLQAYLSNQPISVRPISRMEKAWRWCKRNPAVAGLSVSLFAILTAATVLALSLAFWAWTEQSRANKELDEKLIALDQAKTSATEAAKKEELAQRERDYAQSLLSYLVDLRMVGRNLNERKLRRDFEINIEIKPLVLNAPFPVQPPSANASPIQQQRFLELSRLKRPVFVRSMWYQDQPPSLFPQTQASENSKRTVDRTVDMLLPARSGLGTNAVSRSADSEAVSSSGGTGASALNAYSALPFTQYKANQAYQLAITSEENCYLTAILVQPQLAQFQLIYPNSLSPQILLEKNKVHKVLADSRACLKPSSSFTPDFLYFIATDIPWNPEFDAFQSNGPFKVLKETASPVNGSVMPENRKPTPCNLRIQINSLVTFSSLPIPEQGSVSSEAARQGNVLAATGSNSKQGTVKVSENVLLFHAIPETFKLAAPPKPNPVPREVQAPRKAEPKPPQ